MGNFCSNCGKENINGSKFCNYCGKQLVEEIVEKTTNEVSTQPAGNLGLSIASMVVGVLGLTLTYPLVPVGFILSLLAVIFATNSRRYNGFRKAGLTTGIIGLVIQTFIITIIIMAVIFSSSY